MTNNQKLNLAVAMLSALCQAWDIPVPDLPRKPKRKAKVARKRKRPGRRRWEDSEVQQLIALRKQGVSFRECGKVLKRTGQACQIFVSKHRLNRDL